MHALKAVSSLTDDEQHLSGHINYHPAGALLDKLYNELQDDRHT